MNPRSREEQKKLICTSLVSVIRKSNLRDKIDVNQFYSMISKKYELLYQDEIFDLEPVWSTLAARCAQEDLYGLFLKFGEITDNLGVRVRQAPSVELLPANSQSAYLSDFNQYISVNPSESSDGVLRVNGMGRPVDAKIAGMGTPVDAKIAGMGTPVNVTEHIQRETSPPGGTKPPAEAELVQRIAWAFAQALKATSVGKNINTGQIQFLVTSKFDSLFSGQQFNVDPILDALLEIVGDDHKNLYLALIRFRSLLITMGIEMCVPNLGLSQAQRNEILALAKKQDLEAFRVGGVTSEPNDIGQLPGDLIAPIPAQPTKKEEQLSEYNLPGVTQRSGRAQLVKRIFIALLILGIGALVWKLQPSHTLNISPYRAIFPVLKVESHNGIFVGYLDDIKWLNMSQTERQISVQKLQTKLRTDGFLKANNKCQSMCRQVAVMDHNDKMIIFDIPGGKLKAVTTN